MDRSAFEDLWRIPDGIRRGYADCRTGQLHYAIFEPERPTQVPLVCCHASPVSWRSWQALMPVIGRDRIVVAFDSPGHGDSSKPAAQPTIQDYAAAIGDTLPSLGLRRFDVIGNHTGSKVAVALALQQPQAVRRLVLISAPFYTGAEVATMKARYAEVALAEDGGHWLRRWNALMSTIGQTVPPEIVHRLFTDTLRGGAEYEWGHHAAFAYQHAENLPKVLQPVLVLNPKDEIHEATKRAETHLRNGTLINLDSSHELLELEPEKFAGMLRDFLDGPAPDIDPSTTVPRPAPAITPARATRARRGYMDMPFGQLHYVQTQPDRATRGRPVLCLHASPRSARDFGLIPEVLGSDRIVLAPDMPGLGGSDLPSTPMTIDDWADTMLAFLDQLGIRMVDIFGYHTGSVTAVALALRASERVGRLAVISLPLMAAETREAQFNKIAPDLVVAPDGSHLSSVWQKKWAYRGGTQTLALFDAFMSDYVRPGPFNYRAYYALFGYPLEARLPDVTQPMLVFNPQDEITDNTRQAMALVRDGRLVEVAPWGYGMLDTHAEEIAAQLRDHFDA